MLKDPSGKSDYTFLAYANPHRAKRISQKTDGCPLCGAIEKSDNPALNLGEIGNFVVYPNIFPFSEFASLAISRDHKQMYKTSKPEGLERELNLMLGFSRQNNLRFAHNYESFGASIPNHEHYHFFTLEPLFKREGVHGFENAKLDYCKNSEIQFMPSFPFSHLILPKDPNFVREVIEKVGRMIRGNCPDVEVPHCLIEGEKGILFVPAKISDPKARGATDIAGIWYCPGELELKEASFENCMDYLSHHLFSEKELNLKQVA